MLLWTTQCEKCGPLVIRGPQKVQAGILIGETWCGICGRPVVEILQRRSEDGDPAPTEVTGQLEKVRKEKKGEVAGG